LRPLKAFDPDLVELLITRGAAAGIGFERATTIESIEKTPTGYQVGVQRSGKPETMEFDLVVHGAGRTPELSSLDLDAAGVDWDEHGVQVAGHLQSTTNPAVYAAGDSANTPGMPLTPVAVFEGKVAASNMLKGATIVPDYAGVPTAVFTIPELARVGMLEQEARDQGIDVDVRYSDTSGWYSNYRIGETSAAAKILVDRPSDRIVGAHLLGPEYGELINLLALAIEARPHDPSAEVHDRRLPHGWVRPRLHALAGGLTPKRGQLSCSSRWRGCRTAMRGGSAACYETP